MFVELFVPNVSQQCIGDKIIKAVMMYVGMSWVLAELKKCGGLGGGGG